MASWDLAEAGQCLGWVPCGSRTLSGTAQPGQQVHSHLPHQLGHYKALGDKSWRAVLTNPAWLNPFLHRPCPHL